MSGGRGWKRMPGNIENEKQRGFWRFLLPVPPIAKSRENT
jgi:hypothetical protein